MKLILGTVLLLVTLTFQAPPVANFASVGAFANISSGQKVSAQALRVLIVDRSVGWNINTGLDCIGTPYATAKTACKRYLHVVPEFNNVPETWALTWNRSNIKYLAWAGSGIPEIDLPCSHIADTWTDKLDCFSDYVVANASSYDVVIMMPSYLDVPVAASYVASMTALRNATGLDVVLATSSLARNPNGLAAFNTAVRQTAGFPILDVADIETKNQNGVPSFDNRDGVPYVTPSCSENFPDDGINEPAIAQNFTRECAGGHLGNPDVGKIRIAKSVWWLLANL